MFGGGYSSATAWSLRDTSATKNKHSLCKRRTKKIKKQSLMEEPKDHQDATDSNLDLSQCHEFGLSTFHPKSLAPSSRLHSRGREISSWASLLTRRSHGTGTMDEINEWSINALREKAGTHLSKSIQIQKSQVFSIRDHNTSGQSIAPKPQSKNFCTSPCHKYNRSETSVSKNGSPVSTLHHLETHTMSMFTIPSLGKPVLFQVPLSLCTTQRWHGNRSTKPSDEAKSVGLSMGS